MTPCYRSVFHSATQFWQWLPWLLCLYSCKDWTLSIRVRGSLYVFLLFFFVGEWVSVLKSTGMPNHVLKRTFNKENVLFDCLQIKLELSNNWINKDWQTVSWEGWHLNVNNSFYFTVYVKKNGVEVP